MQHSLGEGLGLINEENCFVIFRDHISDLEYVYNNQQLYAEGLFVELSGYQYHVFIDFRQVQDNEWGQYAHLAEYLSGRGVPDIEASVKEIFLQPVHFPFKELVNANTFRWIIDEVLHKDFIHKEIGKSARDDVDTEVVASVREKTLALLNAVREFTKGGSDPEAITQEIVRKLNALRQLPNLAVEYPQPHPRNFKTSTQILQSTLDDDTASWGMILAWLFTHALGKTVTETDFAAQSRSWIDEWLLDKIIANALQDMVEGTSNVDYEIAWSAVVLVKLLTTLQGNWFATQAPREKRAYTSVNNWLNNSEVQQYLQINRYQDQLWYNKEAFAKFLNWMFTLAVLESIGDTDQANDIPEKILELYDVVYRLQIAAETSRYQVEALLTAARN